MRLLIPLVLAAVASSANGENFDAAFAELKDLPTPKVAAFDYALSLRALFMQGYVIQGRMNGVSTKANMIQFRAESPQRIPGTGSTKLVAGKLTFGPGLIDFATDREYGLTGMPEYPPDKPAATFRGDVRHLIFVENQARLRVRFKDSTQHFLLRYEDGKGLALTGLDAGSKVKENAKSIPDFVLLSESQGDMTWHCHPLTTWATQGGKLLWSTDVQMEGQPKTLAVIGDLLFVTTTAGHSFYIRKDTGELAFYDKSLMAGIDPIGEVLALGEANMANLDKRRSLARFIYAAVVINDRRAIPFLIDCIGKDMVPVTSMAIAALEKFNGNPDFWQPLDPETGTVNWAMAPWSRFQTPKDREAEIAHWQEVFADDLKK